MPSLINVCLRAQYIALFKLFKSNPVNDASFTGSEIECRDVNEWVATADVDCTTEEELTDEKIIETVMQADVQEKDDVDKEDVEPTTRAYRRKDAFDLALSVH
ncbi:hypothetical protein J6590_020028 [Homalodisca vitripennis]|nr:hypothetical protein J6590_020028 [Homalodisca vitripennis]